MKGKADGGSEKFLSYIKNLGKLLPEVFFMLPAGSALF